MSESTSKVSNGTAKALRICTTLLEKPHWGISLLPFMNTKTGLLPTRVSIAALLGWERRARVAGIRRTVRREEVCRARA